MPTGVSVAFLIFCLACCAVNCYLLRVGIDHDRSRSTRHLGYFALALSVLGVAINALALVI